MFLLNILLALFWMALNGTFSAPKFVEGLILGYLMIWLGQSAVGKSDYFSEHYFKKVRQVFGFFAFFLKELMISNLRVAQVILSPKQYGMRPGIVGIPLDIEKDAQIMLLANLITLTPGTLSLDVSTDRKTLYVHSMRVDDLESFRRSIKEGFEKRVQEVL